MKQKARQIATRSGTEDFAKMKTSIGIADEGLADRLESVSSNTAAKFGKPADPSGPRAM